MRNRTMIGVAILLFFSLSVYGQTQPGTVLSFPQVADGPNGNITFTTCINVSNPSAAAANIQLQFYNDNGTPLTLTVNIVGMGRRYDSVFNFSVPRNGSVLVMTGGDSPRLQVGWAKATSNVPVAGTLEYSIYDSTFTLYSQAGWGIAGGQRNFMITAYNDLALGSTGLAWANPNNGTAIIQATLVNAAGAIVQIKTFVLGPNNHQSAFLSALFERMPANGFTGSVYFSSSVDISPIAVLVSANGLITGLAVVQLAGPPSF